MNSILVCFCTFANDEEARRIAEIVVGERLAACANLLPSVTSIYRWKEKIEHGAETLAIFKTTSARYAELQARILSLHSYEVPEIISLTVNAGLPDYLKWVEDSCAGG